MEFDALKDLVSTITRHKAKRIEVLGSGGKSGDLLERFYEGIAKGRLSNDVEAARYLFGTTNTKDPSYRKLKVRLARQLVNTSFFMDVEQPMFSDRQRAMSSCYRDYAAAYLLMTRNDAKKAGIWLLEQILEQSIKFEFVELTADITRLLRTQYSRTVGDSEMHQYYVDLNKKYEEMRNWELTSLNYYEDLIRYYIDQRAPNAEVHAISSRYYEEMAPLADKISLSNFYKHTYLIGIIKCFSVNDCQGVIETCDRALDVLKDRKGMTKGGLITFGLQKILALTQLRQFVEDGEKTFQFCLDHADEGNHNWFKIMEVYFHYCLHARRYEDALNTFERVSAHARYGLLTGSARDDWRLFGAYLHLLALLGQLDQKRVQDLIGPFKLSKFHSDFTVLDKDKEGMNIPRMFLPLLYQLAEGAFWDGGLSTDGLEKYRQRYLNNFLNQRSDIFMRMLIAMIKRPNNPTSADRKMSQELEQLKAIPPELSRQTVAVEVIPYEDLWEMLTHNLK